MANSNTYQLLVDSTTKAVIKLTGKLVSDEDLPMRISANTLAGALDANNKLLAVAKGEELPYYGLTVSRVWYDINLPIPGKLELFWNGDEKGTILNLSGQGQYNSEGNWCSIKNNAVGHVKGDIGLVTSNTLPGSSYSIIIDLHKDQQYYDSGKVNNASAFNYPPFGVNP